jgi:hypothetical protein
MASKKSLEDYLDYHAFQAWKKVKEGVKAEWRKNSSSCYAAAHRLKIIDQATAHMNILNPVGIWAQKDAVLSDAKKYATRSAWYKNSAGAYASAKRNGWFEDAVQHMTSPMKNPQKA